MSTIEIAWDVDAELGLHSRWAVRAVGPHAALEPREIGPPPGLYVVRWKPVGTRARLTGAQVLRDGVVVASDAFSCGAVRVRRDTNLTLRYTLTWAACG